MKVCPECGTAYPVTEGFCPMDGARLGERDSTTPDVSTPDTDVDAAAAGYVGTTLDRRYRLDEFIGAGGMGFVYRATHTLIGKSLAIKLMRPEYVRDAGVVRRFLREARVASVVKHPNVVDISDYGELPTGGAYYVMEYLQGETLAHRIDTQGALSARSALAVSLQVCAGLGAVHAGSIIHRDLKADNVFVCKRRDKDQEPRIKLLDFGIARAGTTRITIAGAVLGTPEYMSPEQAQGFEIDHRSDLYGLGIMLFEMLTGLVPFASDDVATTIRGHIQQAPPHLEDVAPHLSNLRGIDAVVQRLLAKSPEDRFDDADGVSEALRQAMEKDLGVDTAARVHRATLAIGSGTVGESGPEVPAALTEAPADAEPNRRRDGAGTSGGRAQKPRIFVALASAAVVAAAASFGLYWWLSGRSPDNNSPVEPVAGGDFVPGDPVPDAPATLRPHVTPAVVSRPEPKPTVAAHTKPPHKVEGTSAPAVEPARGQEDAEKALEPKKRASRPSKRLRTSVRSKAKKTRKVAKTKPELQVPQGEAPRPQVVREPTPAEKPTPPKRFTPGDLRDPFSSN